MNVRSDTSCFVCGPDNPTGLGARFEIDRDRGRAVCRLTVGPQFQGWDGIVHGGVIAALLDEAAIYACRAFGEQFVTAEINVKYSKPVPVDTELEVCAEVVERRRKLFQVRAEAATAGSVLARADVKVFFLE